MTSRSPLKILFPAILTAGALGSLPAFADTGTILPGQIERQFQKRVEPGAAQGAPQVPAMQEKPPAGAETTRFTLNGLSIEGSSVYADAELHAEFSSLLGSEVSLADIYAIADRLTARYRNDGYVISRVIVPAQVAEGGIIRLQAIEGYVSEIDIVGENLVPGSLIHVYANYLLKEDLLTAAKLERYMLLINDLGGINARATVSPAREGLGAARLLIQVDQRHLSGGLSVDNRGSRGLGRQRYTADFQVKSLTSRFDTTNIIYSTTGDEELEYLSISHAQPIGTQGGNLRLSVSHVRSEPEELAFIPLNLETESDSGSLTFSHPLLRSRTKNLQLRTAATWHNGTTTIFDIRDSRDKVRAIRLGASFDQIDSYRGANLLDMELSRGLTGFGASDNDDLFLSRPGSRVDFTKIGLYAARVQSFSPGWSLLAAINAQYAFTDLLASELFSFGGAEFGRGYDPSQFVGDHGIAAKLELRRNAALPGHLGYYTGYAFFDAGEVHQRNDGGFDSSESATAAGIGIRTNIRPGLLGFVEISKPLTKPVAAEGDRHARVYGGLAIRF